MPEELSKFRTRVGGRFYRSGCHIVSPKKVLKSAFSRSHVRVVVLAMFGLSALPGLSLDRFPAERQMFERHLVELGAEVIMARLPDVPLPEFPDRPTAVFQGSTDFADSSCSGASDDGLFTAVIWGDTVRVRHSESQLICYNVSLNRFGCSSVDACWVANTGRYLVVRSNLEDSQKWLLLDLETEQLVFQWEEQDSPVFPMFSWDGRWLTCADGEGAFAIAMESKRLLRASLPENFQPWITRDLGWFSIRSSAIPPLRPSKDADGSIDKGQALETDWELHNEDEDDSDLRFESVGLSQGGKIRIHGHNGGEGDVFIDPETLSVTIPTPGLLKYEGEEGMLFSKFDWEFSSRQIWWMTHEGKKMLVEPKANQLLSGHHVSPGGKFVLVGYVSFPGGDSWELIRIADGAIVGQGKGRIEGHGVSSENSPFFGNDLVTIDGGIHQVQTGRKIGSAPGDFVRRSGDGEKAAFRQTSGTSHWLSIVGENGKVDWRTRNPISFPHSFVELSSNLEIASFASIDGGKYNLVESQTGKVLRDFPNRNEAVRQFSVDGTEVFYIDESGTTFIDAKTGVEKGRTDAKVRTIKVPNSGGARYGQGKDFPCYLAIDQASRTAEIWRSDRSLILRLENVDFVSDPAVLESDREGNLLLVSETFMQSYGLWDLGRGKKLCRVFGTSSGEWLLQTGDGYYSSSPGIGRKLVLRHRGIPVPTDYLDLLYNRPDKVLEALNGEPSRIEYFRKMHVARLERDQEMTGGTSPETLPPLSEVPTIEIRSSSVTADGKSVSMVIGLGAGIPAETVRVFHNGVVINTLKISELPLTSEAHFELKLVGGMNRFGFDAIAASGARSPRIVAKYEGPEETARPVVHAIFVGASDYSGDWSPLPAVTNDVNALKSAVEQWSGPEQEIRTTVLMNDEANRATVLETVAREASSSEPEDLLIVFMAGHGQSSEKGFEFITTRPVPDSEANELIVLGEVVGAMSTAGALRRLVLIDSCHSGLRASPEYTVPLEDAFRAPYNDEGVVILGAARWNEQAMEGDIEKDHGNFTWALLESLRSDDYRQPIGGSIRVSDLLRQTRSLVRDHSRLQTPTAVSINRDLDMPLLRSEKMEMFSDIFWSLWNQSELMQGGEFADYSYSMDDFMSLTPGQIRILRNTIFARYGRAFDSPELMDFFTQFGERNGLYGVDPGFSENRLDEMDKKNLKTLSDIESLMKSR